MSKQRALTNEDFVPREEAFANALLEAAKFSLSSDSTKRKSLTLNPRATEIFDPNGQLLFYDFALQSGRTPVATIRAVANSKVGSPVVSVRLGGQKWNLANSKKKISEILSKKFPEFKVLKSLLVCYSYPKIGLMVTLSNGNETMDVIFDISDFSIIPNKPENENLEGAFSWSFLDSIDRQSAAERKKKYLASTELTKKVFAGEFGSDKIYQLTDIRKVIDISQLVIKTRIEKELQFCTHYRHDEQGSHHCFILHAQEVNDYCSVATAQMILCYYRYYYSQDQIAPSLGYSPGGGCPTDVSAGYEALSNNHIQATFDSSATWTEARNQIDQLHPMKSGISGHARAAAGYSRNIFAILGSANSDEKLLIYDPWPWNADLKAGGDVYWEDWDSINHTNFVYTQLDY